MSFLIVKNVLAEFCFGLKKKGEEPPESAAEEGNEVFVITEASGIFNTTIRDAAWERMTAAGCQLMTWFGAACELHREWCNDVEGLGMLFSNHLPAYRNLILSHTASRHSASR